jgi:transposase
MKDISHGSGKRERRHFTGAQKAAIVKAHLVDGVAVSDLCDQHHIQPTQFYQWQKQLFENGDTAFERQGKKGAKSPEHRQIEQLQVKLINKNEVIAELMEENVKAKKANGGL